MIFVWRPGWSYLLLFLLQWTLAHSGISNILGWDHKKQIKQNGLAGIKRREVDGMARFFITVSIANPVQTVELELVDEEFIWIPSIHMDKSAQFYGNTYSEDQSLTLEIKGEKWNSNNDMKILRMVMPESIDSLFPLEDCEVKGTTVHDVMTIGQAELGTKPFLLAEQIECNKRDMETNPLRNYDSQSTGLFGMSSLNQTVSIVPFRSKEADYVMAFGNSWKKYIAPYSSINRPLTLSWSPHYEAEHWYHVNATIGLTDHLVVAVDDIKLFYDAILPRSLQYTCPVLAPQCFCYAQRFMTHVHFRFGKVQLLIKPEDFVVGEPTDEKCTLRIVTGEQWSFPIGWLLESEYGVIWKRNKIYIGRRIVDYPGEEDHEDDKEEDINS